MTFATEAEMVAIWLDELQSKKRASQWTVYPETAGWDLLLVHEDGYQLGLEAKLSLNAKVIDQALVGATEYWRNTGPDYRGVLVPHDKVQLHLGRICQSIGIGLVTVREPDRHVTYAMDLPDESSCYSRKWPSWLPEQRCKLPDYIPDVTAGHSSPVQLTDWKVRAIKLMILLERRGAVHRSDMKALQISPTRWCDHYNGFLAPTPGGYVRSERTPDLKAQHPRNWSEIEADFDVWNPYANREQAA